MADPGDVAIGRIHVATAGAGPGLVLLHPNPLDGTSWLFQVAHLSAWFRTAAVDLPGYGHSEPLRGAVSMTGLAQALWRAVDAVGIEDAVLAGVSIGASLALHMARLEPGRARAVILSGCGYTPGKAFAARRIAGYREQGLAYRREHMRDGLSPAFRRSRMGRHLTAVAEDRGSLVDVPSIVHLFEALARPDPDDLFEPACPTLILSGSLDYAHAGARRLHARIEGSTFIALEGAGHCCNLEQPEAWNAHVLDFLARTGLPTPRG